MVLYLSRGRHPVLMNKLRMDPYWDNRPRDLANLTQFASKQLERPFNWQVVSFARPWSGWMDAPVLYVASHAPPKLSADDHAKLKAYADAGGLIFTHADSNSVSFSKWADDLAKRLWPDLGGLKPLDKSHAAVSHRPAGRRRPAELPDRLGLGPPSRTPGPASPGTSSGRPGPRSRSRPSGWPTSSRAKPRWPC